MTPELKAAWVADLRQNQALQTTGTLRSEGQCYCCLGRLAVVAGLKIGIWGDIIESDPIDQDQPYPSLSKLCKVSTKVYVDMNDIHHMTFNEIADFVEANE